MQINYDLHLHSCLSPCGDNDMTPYNLVNMAKIMGLDVIALTDHNTSLNCPAAIDAGKEAGLLVIPGMELCTVEEVHVVCLFEEIQNALDFSSFVRTKIPPVKNRPKIFGEQYIMDSSDNVTGEEELLLTTAADIAIGEVPCLVKKYGGVAFPAHIDRASYSVISNLGEINEYMGFSSAEITCRADKAEYFSKYPCLKNMNILTSSDAHYLENIGEGHGTMELREFSVKKILSKLA